MDFSSINLSVLAFNLCQLLACISSCHEQFCRWTLVQSQPWFGDERENNYSPFTFPTTLFVSYSYLFPGQGLPDSSAVPCGSPHSYLCLYQGGQGETCRAQGAGTLCDSTMKQNKSSHSLVSVVNVTTTELPVHGTWALGSCFWWWMLWKCRRKILMSIIPRLSGLNCIYCFITRSSCWSSQLSVIFAIVKWVFSTTSRYQFSFFFLITSANMRVSPTTSCHCQLAIHSYKSL